MTIEITTEELITLLLRRLPISEADRAWLHDVIMLRVLQAEQRRRQAAKESHRPN